MERSGPSLEQQTIANAQLDNFIYEHKRKHRRKEAICLYSVIAAAFILQSSALYSRYSRPGQLAHREPSFEGIPTKHGVIWPEKYSGITPPPKGMYLEGGCGGGGHGPILCKYEGLTEAAKAANLPEVSKPER